MTTTTPAETRIRALVPLTFTLLSPLHHGAGTSGNSAILRTEEGVNPYTGEDFVVPFVSGNSVRHMVRRACAEVTLATIEAQLDSLSKPLVELLYSGGALTSAASAQVDLQSHRRLDQLWPAAGLLGYASPGQIWAGSLHVDMLLPVCAENTWRMPHHPHLAQHPHAQRPAASLRSETFGTRHDAVGTEADRWISNDLWLGMQDKDQSVQMVTDWPVVKSGTLLYGALTLEAATVGHAQALRVAWEWLNAHGTMRLGGKGRQGLGLCRAEADWSQLPDLDADWVGQLSGHRDELMGLLTQAAGK